MGPEGLEGQGRPAGGNLQRVPQEGRANGARALTRPPEPENRRKAAISPKSNVMTDPRDVPPFRLEEATIDELHGAIRDGRMTCVAVVQHYLERVRAFNGVASALVTEDGARVAPATGATRGGAPLRFPTQTVKASTILPDLDKYKGPPLEFGRMEPTASDPAVPQQSGMCTA